MMAIILLKLVPIVIDAATVYMLYDCAASDTSKVILAVIACMACFSYIHLLLSSCKQYYIIHVLFNVIFCVGVLSYCMTDKIWAGIVAAAVIVVIMLVLILSAASSAEKNEPENTNNQKGSL